MLMIVAGHVVLRHKAPYAITDSDEIIKLFCMSFFSVAVNSFILITGYFGLFFKKERFIRLIFQTFFYSAILLLVSILIGWHQFNPYKDLFALMPVLTKQYWFITCYVVLYIISPWLNEWIKSLDRKTYLQILGMGFVIIYVWPTFSYLFNTGQFIGDSGYGIINFSYLYLLGRFLNLHLTDSHSSSRYFFGYLISAFSLFVCQYSLSWILGFEFTSWLSYNTIFILFGSVCLFMTFKELDFSSRLINYWAKPCLAVYLIHLNPYIWGGFCDYIGISHFHGFSFILVISLLPFVVYLMCSFIEILRIYFLGGLENWVVGKLSNALPYSIETH